MSTASPRTTTPSRTSPTGSPGGTRRKPRGAAGRGEAASGWLFIAPVLIILSLFLELDAGPDTCVNEQIGSDAAIGARVRIEPQMFNGQALSEGLPQGFGRSAGG